MEIFAHRGISALYPENSQSAILACKNQPFTGVEIDLYQVGNTFYILHDRWLSRLFNTNKNINDMSEQDMSKLKCKDGLTIPTLEWLISQLSNSELKVNIELKAIKSVQLFMKQLTQYCEQYKFSQSRLIISSFNHLYLHNISKITNDLNLAMLLASHPVDIKNFVNDIPLFSINLSLDCLSAELINNIHQHNLNVYVYTVDNQSDITWLKNINVDGIFSNDPSQAYKFANN